MIKSTVESRFFMPIMAILHVLAVMVNVYLFKDSLQTDDIRYLAVANDLLNNSLADFSPKDNCISAPGYPMFLALTYWFTKFNYLFIGIAQAVLFILSTNFLLKNLSNQGYLTWFQRNLAFAAAALSPNLMYMNSVVLTESLTTSLFILAFASSFLTQLSKKDIAFLTITFAFLVLTKFEYLVFLPFILLHLVVRKKYVGSMAVALAVIGCLFLNGYKNQQIFGQFQITSFGGAQVLYGGNNLLGDGTWHKVRKGTKYLPEAYKEEYYVIDSLPAVDRCLGRYELFKRMAVDSWKADPVQVMKTIPIKFLKLWVLPTNMDYHTGQAFFKRGLQLNEPFDSTVYPTYALVKHGLYLGIHWLSLLLIIAGAYLRWKDVGLRSHDLYLIGVFIIINIVYAVIFYGLGRFGMPTYTLFSMYMIFPVINLLNKFKLLR